MKNTTLQDKKLWTGLNVKKYSKSASILIILL